MADASAPPPEVLEPFDQLVPLIQDEWPELDGEALQKTKGDYKRVITLIANHTEHTKALVRRQLEELRRVLAERSTGPRSEVQRLKEMVERLRRKSDDISSYVRNQMLQDVKENPLAALFMAMGLGVLIGLILRGLGRGRR